MEFSSWPISSAESTDILPFQHCASVADGVSRIRRHDLADDEPVEQHSDRGQVLLDGRLGSDGTKLLDVSGDVHRLDPLERKFFRLAPNRKLRRGDEVRFPCVAVPDVDCRKFLEAASVISVTLQEDGRQGSAGGCADGVELPGRKGRGHQIGSRLGSWDQYLITSLSNG